MADEFYTKPARVTRAMKAAEEVEYNPLLQIFSDPARERFSREHEKGAVVSHLNRARDRQISLESQFDVINMSNKRNGLSVAKSHIGAASASTANAPQDAPRSRHPLDSSYSFNIVSNLPLSQHHHTAKPQRPPDGEERRVPDSLAESKPRLQTVRTLPRDYNILSNQFVKDHERKTQRERDAVKREAAYKYWETHDLDPITQKYIHPLKEQAAIAAKAAVEELQPTKAFNQLPPSLQKGEGFVYDITSGEVKNAELHEKKKAAEQRWLDSKRATWTREENMTKRGMARQDLDEQRTHNRASHKRYIESFGKGFNIVDHRDYKSADVYVPPSRTIPQATVWQTVSGETAAAECVARLSRQPEAFTAPACLASTTTSCKSGPVVRTGGFQR